MRCRNRFARLPVSITHQIRSLILVSDLIAPLLTAALFAALWSMMMACLPWQENGDGLLETVMSLQKLTVYFWGQDRFANLLPALTTGIRNPLYNAYVQLALRVLAGSLAPAFFCSLAFRRPLDVWHAALATDCLFGLVANPALIWQVYMEASPYGPSLACAGLATLALRAALRCRVRMRLPLQVLAVGLLLTGYVVNFAMVLFALPLVGSLALILRSPFTRLLLLLHLIGAVFGFLLPFVFAAEHHTLLGTDIAFHSYARYFGVLWSNAGWSFVLAAGLPVVLFLALGHSRRRGPMRTVVASIIAVMLAATAIFFFAVASSRWVAMNEFHQRYFIPGYLLLMSTGGIAAWQLFRHAVRDRVTRRALFATLASLLLLITAGRLHTRGEATHDMIGDGKAPLAEAVAGRYITLSLDGIAGDYWFVWPSVFAAEQYRYDGRADEPDVLGIAYRGDARRREFIARLARRGALRVGCIDIDAVACIGFVSSNMAAPGLLGVEFAPAERLPDNHWLSFVSISPPAPERVRPP